MPNTFEVMCTHLSMAMKEELLELLELQELRLIVLALQYIL